MLKRWISLRSQSLQKALKKLRARLNNGHKSEDELLAEGQNQLKDDDKRDLMIKFAEKYRLTEPFYVYDLTNSADHVAYKKFLDSLNFPLSGRLSFLGLGVERFENFYEFGEGTGAVYGISFTDADFAIVAHQRESKDLQAHLRALQDKIQNVLQVHFLSDQKLKNLDIRLLVQSQNQFAFDFSNESDTFKSLRFAARVATLDRSSQKSDGTLIWKD